MRFMKVLRERRVARKGQVSLRDMKVSNKIKVETLKQLNALLSVNDRVMFEISDEAVPYFLDILDDPVFEVYSFSQVDEYHYIFQNKRLFV